MRPIVCLFTVLLASAALGAEDALDAELGQLRDQVRQLRAKVRLLERQHETDVKRIQALREEIAALKGHGDNGSKAQAPAEAESETPSETRSLGQKDKSEPALGLAVRSIDDKVRKALEADGIWVPAGGEGVFVARVMTGSPAHKAGIRSLDVIVQAGGEPISDVKSFLKWASGVRVGSAYKLVTLRISDKKSRGKTSWKRRTVTIVPAAKQAVKKAASSCPLELLSAHMGENAIGQPTVSVVVKNVGAEEVVAYSVGIYCFNRFDEPVGGWGLKSNRFGGLSQKTVNPGQTSGRNRYWTLHGHDSTARVRIVLERVKLADGTEWQPAKSEDLSISAELRR